MARLNVLLTAMAGLGFAVGSVAKAQQKQIFAGQPVFAGRVTPVAATEPETPELTDAQALAAAKLKADDPAALLEYFRLRTLSDADLTRIQGVIQRLGADDFDDRLAASAELQRFGPAAVGPLRAAKDDEKIDPEIAYRAEECLARMETVPHTAVARAAARTLGQLKPPETAEVLLRFLPLADSKTVADEIRSALKAVAVRDGRADPALVAALADKQPVRRAAAAVALIEGSSGDRRTTFPEAYAKIVAAAAAETDVETRFQMLFSLLVVARDESAVGPMIGVLPALPRGRLWQAEDYLIQLAGADAPKAVFGKSDDSLAKARDAWKTWWDDNAKATDLSKFKYTPRIAGKTVLVLMDFRFGNMGEVVELGPDMKPNWSVTGLNSPMDVEYLPNGHVAIAEHNSNRVTIRDPENANILATRTIGGANRVYGNPQQLQVLENGNLLVICRNVVVEFKKDTDEEVMRYNRNKYDIASARRLADGQTIVLLQQEEDHCLFLNAKGEPVENRTLKIGMPYHQGCVRVTGEDTVLVTEMNRVAEYNLKTGKTIWTKSVTQPRSAQRLPNGNTLIVDAQSNRVVEVTADGEEVWTYKPEDGFNVFRAYRR